MQIKRYRAQPNKWTFLIPPVAKLLREYVKGGEGWIDPFAGKCSPAEHTNDLNPEMPTEYHLDALDFCKLFNGHLFNGVLFDPPYSYEQVSRSYKSQGLKVTSLDTSPNFYARVMNELCDKVRVGGYTVSFGWSSNGFGRNRGFHIKEILLIAHGSGHYDTIVTVEEKTQQSFGFMLERTSTPSSRQ